MSFICESCRAFLSMEDIGFISDEMVQCVECADHCDFGDYAYEEPQRIHEVNATYL